MNQQRFAELDTYLRTETHVERDHLRGVHGTRIRNARYDEARQALDYSGFEQYLGTLSVVRHERYSETLPHFHGYVELNYMYSGQMQQVIDGQPVLLERGAITLVDTQTVHSLSAAGENDLLLNIVINREFLARELLSSLPESSSLTRFFVNALNNRSGNVNYLVFDAKGNDRLDSVLQELFYEGFFPSQGHDALMLALFHVALLEMLPSVDVGMMQSRLAGGNLVVADALSYLDENYLDCSLAEAAQVVGVSESYLTTLLRRTTGETFGQIVLRKKLGYAQQRLQTSDDPVERIARECGYDNLTFFYRKFREQYGCTPNQVRRRV